MSQEISGLGRTFVAVLFLSFLFAPASNAQNHSQGASDHDTQQMADGPEAQTMVSMATEVGILAYQPSLVPAQPLAEQSELTLAPDELESEPGLSPENSGIAAAIADGVTTMLALSGGAVESNPLVSTSPLGLIALTGMKIGWVNYSATFPEPEKRLALKSSSAIWGGAAVNNLLVALAVPSPISVIAGLLMGVITWNRMENQYQREDELIEARKKKLFDDQAEAPSKLAIVSEQGTP